MDYMYVVKVFPDMSMGEDWCILLLFNSIQVLLKSLSVIPDRIYNDSLEIYDKWKSQLWQPVDVTFVAFVPEMPG